MVNKSAKAKAQPKAAGTQRFVSKTRSQAAKKGHATRRANARAAPRK